jgi:transposase-like protein
MNQRRKFTEDFKQEAAAQVIERGYPIKEVANHLGIQIRRYTTSLTQGCIAPGSEA